MRTRTLMLAVAAAAVLLAARGCVPAPDGIVRALVAPPTHVPGLPG
jgi:hypothetical protein